MTPPTHDEPEILRALSADPADLLVCDIAMSDEDGLTFLRKVRALGPMGRLPALALTALARSEDKAKVLAAGFDAYLSKPVEPAVLIAALAGLVPRRPS